MFGTETEREKILFSERGNPFVILTLTLSEGITATVRLLLLLSCYRDLSTGILGLGGLLVTVTEFRIEAVVYKRVEKDCSCTTRLSSLRLNFGISYQHRTIMSTQ